MCQRVRGANTIRGRIRVPGDKSISHRALILGALARGESEVSGLSPGADVLSTRTCLQDLGVRIEGGERDVLVHGHGLAGLEQPRAALDCGNSGTTMRLLAGVLAGRPFRTTLVGDGSLSRRPMGRVIVPLREMGARIGARKEEYAPLTIRGGNLQGIRYRLPVNSAQVKSCVLLAGLQAEGGTVVIEPVPSRDHTERLLRCLGGPVEVSRGEIRIGRAELVAQPIAVPGDFSSAAFFLAAAAALPGSELIVEGVSINPSRTGLLDVLQRMGADFSLLDERGAGEPMADILMHGGQLAAVEVGGEIIPRLIDEGPLLFVLATQARGTTVVRGAEELRFKESDRVAAMADNLRRLGAAVRELPDGVEIQGPTSLSGAELDGFGDHRVVMACAVAGLFASGSTTIRGAEWADISFPGFFQLFEEVRGAR